MKKYIIYMHTIFDKSYIGYTSKSLEERLHKHIINALSGIDTKFYRCIRNHGPKNIISKILIECNDEVEVKQLEKNYIKQYNTFKTGLNSTEGGDGGDIINSLSDEKYKKFIDVRKKLSIGNKNSNYSGYTDKQIIEEAVKYFNINKKLIFNHWFKFCRTKKMPVNYTKFRFDGEGRVGFLKQLKNELKIKNITFNDSDFVYDKRDKTRCENLSKSIIGRNWYNDGKNNYMLYSNDGKITTLNLKKGLLKYVKN
jgi:hypothetical protein